MLEPARASSSPRRSIAFRVRGWAGKTTGISRASRASCATASAEQRPVDERRPVERHEHELARLEAARARSTPSASIRGRSATSVSIIVLPT